MSTENNTEKPKKKPIEELILSKPITPEIVNKLFDVYKEDWEKYSAEMTEILDQTILDKIKDIKVLVDRIDTQPSCENCFDIKKQLLNDEKKKIFCMWLFKSHILCVNANERIAGRKIEHDLPVMFKIYLNKSLADRINSITNLTSKIEQYNKAVDMVLKDFKNYLGDKEFFFKRVDAATVESDLDSVQVCLGFNTYYTEQEHGYIKEFVKEVITDEKKSKESLDQSSELFGHNKKKEEKIVKLTKEEATKAVKNCVKLLKDAFAKNGNPNGFNYYSDSELKKQIEEYLDEDNSYNSIAIGSYDAWKYTDGKARDENEYYKFNDIFIKIENTIKDLMKQSNCPYNISSDGGDWDDGYYTVYFSQKPNLEHEKNYMGSEESLDQSEEGIGAVLKASGVLLLIYTAYEVIKGLIGIKKEEKEKEKYMNSDEFKKFAKEVHELALKAMDYQSYIIKNINNKMKKKYDVDFDFSSKWLYNQFDEKTVIEDFITPYLMKYRNEKNNNIIACTMDICTSEDIDTPDINQDIYDEEKTLIEMYDYFVKSLNELAYEWLKKNAKGKLFYDTSDKPINTKSVIYTSTLYYEIFPLTLIIENKSEESLDQSEEGFFNGRFFKKDKLESNGFLQYKSRPTWMKDFVTSSNKLFCSHFKELENYVAYKGYKIATKNDVANLPHNFLKCKDHYSPDYECDKIVGKFIFSCCSYNNSGSAHLYVINSKNKIETIKYIGGVLTKKTALRQTVIYT